MAYENLDVLHGESWPYGPQDLNPSIQVPHFHTTPFSRFVGTQSGIFPSRYFLRNPQRRLQFQHVEAPA
jgi:hypothetical protein